MHYDNKKTGTTTEIRRMGGIVSDQLSVIDGVNTDVTTGSVAALKASNSCIRFKQPKAAKKLN